MKFLEDKEINLNDIDYLDTKTYAETLKEIILECPTPFNIGLFGEWGSGKSSIVTTVKHELERLANPKIRFVIYDAWKYVNDSFRRMFLKEMQEQLNFEGSDLYESFYVNKNEEVKIHRKINVLFIFIAIIVVLIGILSVFLLPKALEIEWKIGIPLFVSMVGIGIAFSKNFFDSYKISIQHPKMFAPEQFEQAFKEMVNKSLKKYSMIEKAFQWFKGNKYEKDIDKLVVVIDNIDRCDKETAYELLTNIKNFLSQKEGLVFLIPIDDEALKSISSQQKIMTIKKRMSS